jgi:hypothetical protein
MYTDAGARAAEAADRVAHEFREAAAAARRGGQDSLAETLDDRAEVMCWSASLRRDPAWPHR